MANKMIEFTAGVGNNFELLPKGTYDFRVTKNEVKPTKAGDGNTMHIKCEVIEGPFEGKTQTLFATLKKDKAWQLANLLKACMPGKYEEIDTGAKDEDGKPVFTYRFDPDDLIDTSFRADIKHSKDLQGNDRSEFASIKEIPSGAPAAGAPAPNLATGEAGATADTGGEARSLRRRIAG